MPKRTDIKSILIIGAGHAGTEAAWIASQFGLNIGLVTGPNASIASI